jgi:hypothetical protein
MRGAGIEATRTNGSSPSGLHEILISDIAWNQGRGFSPFRSQHATSTADAQHLDRQSMPILTDDAHALIFQNQTLLDRMERGENRTPDE